MEHYSFLLILSCVVLSAYAWSVPFYPVHAVQRMPHRYIRHVRHAHHPPPQPYRLPVPIKVREPTATTSDEEKRQRPKRDHDYDHDHDHDHDHSNSHDHDHRGVTGPVHTFVKTDKNANYKWGVRHHVGNKFAS